MALAAASPGQHGKPLDHRRTLPPPPQRTVEPAAEHHQLATRPLPSVVMAWLTASLAARAGAPREAEHQAGHHAGHQADQHAAAHATAAAPHRPTGAGRWVVAVVVDPTADLEPHAVLGLARSDVLVLAAPGLSVRPEELALLEHAQAQERVALCLLMTREGSQPTPAPAATPAAQALARRLEPAQALAARSGEALMPVQARLQAASIVSASEPLRVAAKAGLFRTAVALLPARGDTPKLIAPWHDKPLPEESLAEQARAREQQAPPAPGGGGGAR